MKQTLMVLTALLLGTSAFAVTINVPADYSTIQEAIDAAVDGDEILVAAGTYEEQLNISKDISIIGAGVGATIVLCPDVLTDFFTTSSDNYPIVYVHDTDAPSLADLTVDGAGKGNANYRFVGLGFWNAGGSLTDVDITDVRDTPFSGSQHGVGVYSYNDTGGPYDIAMTDINVVGFQKAAVALAGGGLNCDLLRVDTIGAGPTTVTAQNGIQISYGAGGTVSNCHVWGIDYTGASWSATGILPYLGTDVHISNSTVEACQTSVYFIDTSGSLNSSTIINPTSDGMYIYSQGARTDLGPRAKAQAFDIELAGPPQRVPITFLMDGTVFTGFDGVDSWGVCPWAVGPIDFTAINCELSNWDWALVPYESGAAITGAANNNCLGGNLSYGLYAETAGPFDATLNWWGDASGPGGDGPGSGSGVGGNAVYEPWATDDLCGGTATEDASWSRIKAMY